MKKSLARGAVVAFVSAASVIPLAGGAQAAITPDTPSDTPSAVSTWLPGHDGFRRCERFGDHDRFGEGREGRGEDRGEDRGEGRGEGRGWWGPRDQWWSRYCGPWGIHSFAKRERLDYFSINNSAFVILR